MFYEGTRMSDLTTNRRNNLSSSTFGLPSERKYPMPDKAHAVNAEARATQQYNKGNLTGPEKKKIDAKAALVIAKVLRGK